MMSERIQGYGYVSVKNRWGDWDTYTCRSDKGMVKEPYYLKAVPYSYALKWRELNDAHQSRQV